jgi:hypothetical protein
MRVVMLTCALGLAAAACTASSGSSRDGLSSTDPDNGEGEEICEVDPDAIGVVGEVPTHGSTPLSVTKWTLKAGTKNQYVGFQLSRQARFTVIVGARGYQGEGTSWIHPDGLDGEAITGLDFCDDYCDDNGGFPDIDQP